MNFKILLLNTTADITGQHEQQMIKLPVSKDALNKIIKQLETDSFGKSDYVYVGYQSPIFELNGIIGYGDSVADLNELAKKFVPLEDDYEKLFTYKALVEQFKPNNTNEAIALLDKVNEYQLLDGDIDAPDLLGRYLTEELGFETDGTYSDYEAIGIDFPAYFTSYGYLCKKVDLERRI